MTKALVKIVVLLVIGLLAYNFFFGSPEEKERSRNVVGQVAKLGESVFDLLKSEKEKFDEGKYDEALSKIKQAIGMEKSHAAEIGPKGEESLGKCKQLEEQELAIEQQLEAINPATMSDAEYDAAIKSVREAIMKLAADTESVAHELESHNHE